MILGNFYDFPYRNSIFLLRLFPSIKTCFSEHDKSFPSQSFLPFKEPSSTREVKNVPNLLLNAIEIELQRFVKTHQPYIHLEVDKNE
jgi:hypothetical protein